MGLNMKKKILLLFPLLSGAMLLASCDGTSSYHTITYLYNNETVKDNPTYITAIIKNGEKVVAPAEPNVEDYVFLGWYTDAACKNAFEGWDATINSDLTLYADWKIYRRLSDTEKIQRFQEKLATFSVNATTVTEDIYAEASYPGITGSDDIYYGYRKNNLKRYKDITEEKQYYRTKAGVYELLGTQQYYYDDDYFYSCYYDDEDSSYDACSKEEFDETKIESFLSIDFANINKAIQNSIIALIASDSWEKGTNFDYEFDFNYTKLNKGLSSYTYTEGYAYSVVSDQIGTVTFSYAAEYGLVFDSNGMIKSVNAETLNTMSIDGETYSQEAEQKAIDYYYGDGTYPDFDGEKLPYKDTSSNNTGSIY